MFTFDTKSVVEFIVNNQLDRNSRPEFNDGKITMKGLYIKFPVKVKSNRWDSLDNAELQHFVHMVFFGNTSVFYFIDYDCEYFTKNPPLIFFINSCNHDSCWKDDGLNFLTELYFDMCHQVNSNVAPVKLDSTSLLSWTSDVKQVDVTFRNVSNGNERYKLLSLDE